MYKRILVAVDGSSIANAALDEAIRIARGQRCSLRLVHVIDTVNVNVESITDIAEPMRESGRRLLRDAEARVRRARVKAESSMLEIRDLKMRVSDLVVAEAARWRADLIVIGTHGRRGLNRLLLGSVADSVVRSAPAPVLLVRGR